MEETNVKVQELKALINKYHQKDKELKDLTGEVSELKATITGLMEANEIDSFEGDECKVSLVMKNSVSVPKDMGSKRKLFSYIKEKHGEEVLDNMLTINARTFSSFYNTEETNALEIDGVLEFTMPGIDSTYQYASISKRKKTAKKAGK